MVGMAVTYAPFLNHNVIRSVRPIYQGPDGNRYDGPVCGNPTGVGERVVAKEGYAIGAAAIAAALAIDGMQLTFMKIGAEGLNPDKTYLSKWLGDNGGSRARTYRKRRPADYRHCWHAVQKHKCSGILHVSGHDQGRSDCRRRRPEDDANATADHAKAPAANPARAAVAQHSRA